MGAVIGEALPPAMLSAACGYSSKGSKPVAISRYNGGN